MRAASLWTVRGFHLWCSSTDLIVCGTNALAVGSGVTSELCMLLCTLCIVHALRIAMAVSSICICRVACQPSEADLRHFYNIEHA